VIRIESALRPRSFGEICDAALETLRRDLAVHATATLLVSAPLAATIMGLVWAVKALGGKQGLVVLPLAALAAALTLLRPVALGAVAVAARERVERGRAPRLSTALGTALRSGLSLAFAGIAFWVVALMAGVLYVLPGLLFGGWCSLGVTSAALEGTGPVESMLRSVRLLKGHAGRAIALLIFSSALYAILGANAFAAVQAALMLGSTFLGIETAYWQAVLTPGNGLFATFVMLVVHAAIEPWKACAFYHLHLDARIRHEALDLRRAIERLRPPGARGEGEEGAEAGDEASEGTASDDAAVGARATSTARGGAIVAAALALWLGLGLAGRAEAAPPDEGGGERDARALGRSLGRVEGELRAYAEGDPDLAWDDEERRLSRERIRRAIAEAEAPWVDLSLEEGAGGEEAYQRSVDRALERVRALRDEVERERVRRERSTEASGAGTGRGPSEARAVLARLLEERQFQETLAPEPQDEGAPVGEALGSIWQRLANWVERLWNDKPEEDPGWFLEWLKGNFGPLAKSAAGLPWQGISIAILLIVAIVLLRLAAKHLRPGVVGGARAGAAGPNALVADAMSREASHFRAEGDRLLGRGDRRGAVRAYYVGILSALHHRRLLKLEPSETNWEHAARLRGRPDLHARVVPATRTFDLAWYGGVTVAEESVRDVAQALEEIEASPAAGADRRRAAAAS